MYKILVVEDEDVLREELTERLEFEGYESSGMPDGITAIDAVVRTQPDLILCDLNMPGLDGFGVIHTLRSEFQLNVPVIVLSAMSDELITKRAMAAGANAYIVKPFSFADLLIQIKSLLS